MDHIYRSHYNLYMAVAAIQVSEFQKQGEKNWGRGVRAVRNDRLGEKRADNGVCTHRYMTLSLQSRIIMQVALFDQKSCADNASFCVWQRVLFFFDYIRPNAQRPVYVKFCSTNSIRLKVIQN
jgi:hypothetical protein